MALGNNIKKHRKDRNLSQEQLAEAMGVSTAAVSKWETGIAVPELTALTDLADYFEVSIDALVGHIVSDDRKNALLAEMDQLSGEEKYDEAKSVAEKLLQRYPNDAAVADRTASLFYRVYICTGERNAMERSVELTKRLFALEEDPTGMKRFELMSSLGNQYELLQEWETARKYYTDSNIAGLNDRALAGLLAREGKDGEAARAISDVLAKDLFHIMTDLIQLANNYNELEETEKADGALLWGIGVLEMLSGEAVEHLMPIKSTMYLSLALSAEMRGETQRADCFIRSAAGFGEKTRQYDFLTCSKNGKVIGTMPVGAEMLVQMLSGMQEERLASVVRSCME